MTTDGVLGAALLPTDGYIDPSQLTFALAEGARRGGAEIETNTRVTAIGVERGRVTRHRDGQRRDRDGARRQRRRDVREGDRRARGRERADRAHGARVPRDEALGPAARHADDARPVAPRLLPPRVGRSDHGRLRARTRSVVARRDPGRLQRPTARRGLAALRAAAGERDPARAGPRGDGGRPADQRPGGVHSRQRVHPRADRRARLLGRGRLLRARARGRRRDGPARRRVDARGRSEPRRLGDGLAPLRHAPTGPRVHARADGRGLLDLLRRQVPGARAAGGPAAANVSDLPAPAGARRGVRREVRVGATELVRAERRATATSRSGRAAGPAGSGRRRSVPSTARRARPPHSSTRRASRRSRSRARVRRHSSSVCATTGSRATSARSPTPRC